MGSHTSDARSAIHAGCSHCTDRAGRTYRASLTCCANRTSSARSAGRACFASGAGRS